MKPIPEMSIEELGGLVCESLQKAGITVTLTGGACVAIWSGGQYISHDLDFIEEGPVSQRKIREVLGQLGFTARMGRHFVHPESEFFVEFPVGPLMVGDERVEKFRVRKTLAGALRLLSPTDCVKDRLAAFYLWNDREALQQALLVAHAQKIDLANVRRWSVAEDNEGKFRLFRSKLRARRP